MTKEKENFDDDFNERYLLCLHAVISNWYLTNDMAVTIMNAHPDFNFEQRAELMSARICSAASRLATVSAKHLK